jgi:hypothetical protein
VEAKQVLVALVQRAFHTHQGHEEGARGQATTQGHLSPTETGDKVVRDRLGHCAEVYLFR